MVLVEFWLAGWFGRAWLRLHSSLRPLLGDLPAACALVERGKPMPAGRLWRALDFAVRALWRSSMAVGPLFLPLVILLGISVPLWRRLAETALTWLLYTIIGAAIVGLAQAGLIRYRSNQNRRWWSKGKSSPEEPLPSSSDGLPRRSDFWLATLLAVTACLILGYASTRSSHR